MPKPNAILSAFFLCLPAIATAQRSANPSSTPAPPAPAVAVRPAPTPATGDQEGRVKVDVVVTDSSGNPVSGLDRNDFTLLDDYQPGKILSFRAFGGEGQPASPPVEVILLIDDVNQDFTTVTREKSDIGTFLRSNGGHLAQRVAIFAFTNQGVKIVAQPSTDGNALAAQLSQADIGLRSMGASSGMNGQIELFQLSLQWMTELARNETKRHGRKLMIWVGPGWPMLNRVNADTSRQGQQQLFDRIVVLSTAMREARLAVYSISLGQANMDTFVYQGYLKGVKTPDKANPQTLGLKVLAVQSGGRVVGPDNNIAPQIVNCIRDAGTFYTLSFDPPRADRANEYHDLKVKVEKPGLTARTSAGYYNQP